LPAPDGSPNHSHSKIAFDTIAHLNHIVVDVAPFFVLAMAFMLLLIFFQPSVYFANVRSVSRPNLRAPPLL
jgi:hypothetical protein